MHNSTSAPDGSFNAKEGESLAFLSNKGSPLYPCESALSTKYCAKQSSNSNRVLNKAEANGAIDINRYVVWFSLELIYTCKLQMEFFVCYTVLNIVNTMEPSKPNLMGWSFKY